MAYLLHHCIERAADPRHEAFRIGENGLSYAQLDALSSRLARCLGELGLGVGDRVGIMLGKSLDVPVAVYGVLRAGAVVVPIDASCPPARLRFQIEDCDLRILITDARRMRTVREVLHEDLPLRTLIGIDESPAAHVAVLPWSAVASTPELDAPVPLTEQDLACILYTSGSTGAPKGLAHTHASVLAYARLSAAQYDVRPGDRIGAHSPLHVDMSTFALYSGPYGGATSVIVPDTFSGFPVELCSLIEREVLTHWYSVPFPLLQMLDRGEPERFDHAALRWIKYGGEPVHPARLRAMMSTWPAARIANVYGPAETNQCTHHTVCAEDVADDMASVPIGDAWANTRVHVIDADGHEADEGELLIQSATMMRGYWRRPDLDEAAFEWRDVGGALPLRFYRSGDVVRRRAGGPIEFLGRRDRQVKLRGFRVELDDIESALASHEAVSEAAVVALTDDHGERYVAAAAIVKADSAVSSDELCASLRARVPPHAMPGRVELFDVFPRTGTGKIDRRALAERLA